MTSTALGIPRAASPGSSSTEVVDAADTSGMPTSGPMRDTYGRNTRDLRVSVTDRCNLRCTYCMPAEGMQWLPRSEVLTAAEIVRLVKIGVYQLGVTDVRFTGGEPLIRADLSEIARDISSLPNAPSLSVTTNGLGLRRHALALAAAGIARVNVSLDTLDRARFAAITRRDRLNDVLDGLAAAKEAGLFPIKVNAVLDPRHGLDDASALLQFCLDHGYELRIIEQMPLDADHQWSRSAMLTADQIYARLAREVSLAPDPRHRGSSPAATWVVDGYTVTGGDGHPQAARVGIIASVTRPFCGDCDRTRLTADGQLRTCLFSTTETDVRSALRGGASDSDIAMLWRTATWGKLPGHAINDPGFLQPARSMSAIGG